MRWPQARATQGSTPDTGWPLVGLGSRFPSGLETAALAISGAVGRASGHPVGVHVGGPTSPVCAQAVCREGLVGCGRPHSSGARGAGLDPDESLTLKQGDRSMDSYSFARRLRRPSRRAFGLLAAAGLALSAISSSPTSAHDEIDDGLDDDGALELPLDLSAALEASDNSSNLTAPGSGGAGSKTLDVVGRGVRNVGDATTDVWAYGGYAYTGTFNSPCGGEPGAGVWIWDVHNKNKPSFEGIIPSPVGSRSNDVKAATMNSGDILVHSNESCGGGPGGFEIYNVDDPSSPVFLSSVRINELNAISDDLFGGLNDLAVHNLFLFRQGNLDYVGVVSEGACPAPVDPVVACTTVVAIASSIEESSDNGSKPSSIVVAKHPGFAIRFEVLICSLFCSGRP